MEISQNDFSDSNNNNNNNSSINPGQDVEDKVTDSVVDSPDLVLGELYTVYSRAAMTD
jgi:hypothetical protein